MFRNRTLVSISNSNDRMATQSLVDFFCGISYAILEYGSNIDAKAYYLCSHPRPTLQRWGGGGLTMKKQFPMV